MPITVEHQPPFQAVGGVAYDAGWNQGIAQRRQELWQRQMQLAQLQEQQQAQQAQMYGPQAGHQSRANIEKALGNINPENLTQAGTDQYGLIQKELADAQKNIGTWKP